MEPADPNFAERVTQIFARASFIEDLGIGLQACGPGFCVSALTVQPRHWQQDGFVHAGVLATMADHTAGAAAGTLLGPGGSVLTVEFKINLLRPATGPGLRCRAEVLKPGRRLSVVEAEVFAQPDGQERLVAKAMSTVALVKANDLVG